MNNDKKLALDEAHLKIMQVVDLVDCLIDVFDDASAKIFATPEVNRVFSLTDILSEQLKKAEAMLDAAILSNRRENARKFAELEQQQESQKEALAAQEAYIDYLVSVCEANGFEIRSPEEMEE